MDDSVSAAEANRNFSRLLRSVREGKSFTVTSHGRPIARIIPVDEGDSMRRTRQALFERLAKQPAVNAGTWTREELYERER